MLAQLLSAFFALVPYIAKIMNKLCIYYDPVNYVFKNDVNSNNIKIISGVNELS
jgi:hypothetical protein